jgi:putative GTP pyrophosphokinase
VRDGSASAEDLAVIDEWRAAHRAVLNTFQASLRTRTRLTGIYVAQRHKRKRTIFGKLERFPEMQLARMDDVAGCRLIFPDIKTLYTFRDDFLKARFNHRRRNDVDRYDYIKRPKDTGYRGVHDVYEYDVRSAAGGDLKGLLVEIQYRTIVQHAWATAVEVLGFVTTSQPKFQQGDKRYEEAMAYASEIIARSAEGCKGPLPDLPDKALVEEFLKRDEDLGLIGMLRGLNAADADITSKRNAILLIRPDGDLQVMTYRDATEALRELFRMEKQHPDDDVVLVRADSGEEVRFAFRNYFSDARDFVQLIENGCEELSGTKRAPLRSVRRKKRRAKRR